MDILGLHFIRPAWLLALPLAGLLPWAWRRWRRPSGDWARVCDPHLLRWLAVGETNGSRRRGLGAWLAGLALALSVLALSGPSWQRLPDIGFSATDARVIVVDLSQSMLAQDLRPDRLTRARFRLSDLLAAIEEGQVGLVAYAGDAYVVSPLTSDTNTVINMLPALRPDVVPVAGSRADLALEMAAELLQRSGLGQGEVLLVTDSADARAVDAAGELRDQGMITSVLAVGTPEGAPIPSGSGFLGDASGNIVIATLEDANLRALARAGGGRYSLVGDAVEGSPWARDEGEAFARRDDGAGARWRDFGPWLLLGLLPLAALGFRRGALFSHATVAGLAGSLAVASLAVPSIAEAGLWDDLWQRRDQQAQQALAQGESDRAAVLARDPAIAAEARYRAGDHAAAATAWSSLEDADAQYNLGNALAQQGRLDEAIAAYDRALAMNPDLDDALYNRALVEQAAEQQKQDADQGEGEGEQDQGEPQASDEDSESDQQQSGDGEQEAEQGENSESESQEPGQSEPGQEEAMAQAWSEEDEQAMEQWLRRIPDDPGGLLRRKFQIEHQRRGAPPDEGDPW
ncbi:VWA domain-containing protein [Marinihelvus fidelis]|uniref:VWA domain-containing protein n=1 Tax=Marinihelvus fidelis TaxID=2613842 RepID=A0A5N0TA50_9GAMM|nr:VWA domain-containing protein [Marinihelvus fidelis]KAA9131007.1 VWA domain-containing protein [Marinihelvus fidelis]